MTSIVRNRDVVVFFKGDSYAVAVSPSMVVNGWNGGQGVQWTDANGEFCVTYSDGLYGGFLLWGSNEVSDQYIATVKTQPTYAYAVACFGGWLMSTTTYEKYTYASRISGPLVPITYVEGQRLRFSLRGFWTIEDEWALSSDPRGSNQYFSGSVMQAPKTLNDFYLTVQTSI